jgi:hypothetical protein
LRIGNVFTRPGEFGLEDPSLGSVVVFISMLEFFMSVSEFAIVAPAVYGVVPATTIVGTYPHLKLGSVVHNL